VTPRSLDLEIELATEKERLRTSLARLSARANDALDWRQQFRRHPAGLLGAALAAGVVLGAATGGPSDRRRTQALGDTSAIARGRTRRNRPSGAWDRVMAGVSGMLADRAILAARDLLDGFFDDARNERRRARSGRSER
jgi:hypothetical protein